MTQDEIIRMAREAGLIQYVQVEKTCVSNALERFAALVAEPWIETNKALAKEIIELKKQAEQDLDTCPGCGGIADNGHDREFPPNPYYCTKCTEQAEQEPVGMVIGGVFEPWNDDVLSGAWEIYAAPVSIEAAVLAEREACAKVCDEWVQIHGIEDVAAAIRARGEK